MPLVFSVNGNILSLTSIGDYPLENAFEVMEEAFHHPELKQPVDILLDLSPSMEKRSAKEIYRFVDYFSGKKSILSKRFAIVTDQALHFGLARMFGTLVERFGLHAEVFRNYDEAVHWLNSKNEIQTN